MLGRSHTRSASFRRLCLSWLIAAHLFASLLAPSSAADPKPPVVDPAIQHLYVRNRRQAVGLATAAELAASARYTEFTQQLQWLLDQPSDSWLIDPDRGLVSVSTATEELFAAQGQPVFEQYRRTLGPTATQELARIAASPDVGELFSLVRRFGATDAGFQAADRLLSTWLDAGEWWRASELGLSFVMDDRRAALLSPAFVRRTWLACRLAGRYAEATAIAQKHASRTSLNAELPELPTVSAHSLWRGPGGGVDRNARTSATPPLLNPVWKQSLEFPEAYPKSRESIDRWLSAQREQDAPSAVGWSPVMAAQRLVFRDFDSIVAVDVATGGALWRQRTSTGLAALVNQPGEDRSSRTKEAQKWEAALANSLVGSLSTDGRRVYALDHYEALLQLPTTGFDPREQGQAARRSSARNALLALDLTAVEERGRIVWNTSAGALREQWAGHAFLGAPLPYEGWLYVISEFDRELRLSAIDPVTGRPWWQQPIAEVERSIVEDRGRNLRASVPTVAQGLVLCPTQIGLVVAVDALTGRLRWAHNSLTVEAPDSRTPAALRPPRMPMNIPQPRRHAGFAPLIHAHADRAVFLSPDNKATCVSVADGRQQWSVVATDAEFIGAMTDEIVLVVGRSRCQGFSLADGRELWKQSLPAPPAGTGLARNDSYLLPLGNGHVVQLRFEDGAAIGFQFRSSPEPLGHLVATPDQILSVGALGVTAYPQAAAVRRQRALEQTVDEAATLAFAEIQLTEGDLPGATQSLESLLSRAPDKVVLSAAEALLRQSYLRSLAEPESDVDRWLVKLKPLCKSAPDRLAWLMAASEHARSRNEGGRIVPWLAELAVLPSEAGISAVPHESGWSVSPRVWLRLLADTDDDDQRTQLQSELRSLLLENAVNNATAAVTFALDDDERAVASRFVQARAARTSGDWHRAEMLLLRDAHGTSSSAAAACLELASLYESAGLLSSSGSLLQTLSRRFGDRQSPDGRSYADLLSAWPRFSGTAVSWQRRQPWGQRPDRVTITVSPGSELALGRRPADLAFSPFSDERFDGFHRQLFAPSRPDSPLEWVSQVRDTHAVYGAFDRTSAQNLAEFDLPLGAQPQNPSLSSPPGSGLPFGLPAELRMLSVLQGSESGVAWSTKLTEWQGRSGQPIVGPTTSRVVTMQLKSDLIAVDAADGTVLWKRGGLTSGSGLYGNVRNGLSADEDYITVLEPGQNLMYRVFDAATGRLHRQGTAPASSNSPICPVRGRLHVFRTSDALPHLRIWDPAFDTFVVDAALHSSQRHLIDITNATHVAWIAKGLRLCIFDVEERQMAVDVPLTEGDLERVTSLRTFRQNGRYYAALQSDQPVAQSDHYHAALPSDSFVPSVGVKDDFLALSADGRAVLWRTVLPNCSVILWGDIPAPVLVMVSSMRQKQNQNRRWLQVQAVDPDNGRRLGQSGELPIDSILAADYDGVAGSIRLLGRRTTYELQLRTARASLDEIPAL